MVGNIYQPQHKHLGIWLTSTLCFSKQVHEVCIKDNMKLAFKNKGNFFNCQKSQKSQEDVIVISESESEMSLTL